MTFLRKTTQTLICSCISIILTILIFNRIIPECQAIVNPLSFTNNKFGVHLISATPQESSPAAQLVGDWGYVTVLIESKDRDHNKWQQVFNDFRKRHLIPLVRLATQPEGAFWKRPYEGEEEAWTDFLDLLNWPVKNRYIIIYNEPNQGQEWGNQVDAPSYARTLSKTIDALKAKNPDFFVLNAGFDASAPQKLPLFQDELVFLKEMNEVVPGIFNKLDGWVSHSYPNPGFAGSPKATGRGTTSTYLCELNALSDLGLNKNLPIFITETGWKHAEGLTYDKSLPDSEQVGKNLQYAFENTWNNPLIVAVTPFLLDYQDFPFDHFSFKKPSGQKQDLKVLGLEYPQFYPQFELLASLAKVGALPKQDSKGILTKGEVFKSVVKNESYTLSLTFKNSGQSIWNELSLVKLGAIEGGQALGVTPVELPKEIKIEPGQEYTFNLHLKATQEGTFPLKINLFSDTAQFDQPPLEYQVEVKQPVILLVKAALKWKDSPIGEYFLLLKTILGESIQKITLDKKGPSKEFEARYILPDYEFDFTLERQFYKPKTIHQTVHSGPNLLDFGVLEPDFISALLHPKELWKLTPWSNP